MRLVLVSRGRILRRLLGEGCRIWPWRGADHERYVARDMAPAVFTSATLWRLKPPVVTAAPQDGRSYRPWRGGTRTCSVWSGRRNCRWLRAPMTLLGLPAAALLSCWRRGVGTRARQSLPGNQFPPCRRIFRECQHAVELHRIEGLVQDEPARALEADHKVRIVGVRRQHEGAHQRMEALG